MAQFTKLDADLRFWEKVDRRGSDECWPWLASHIRGYGRFWTGEREVKAHRWSYEIHIGPIPEGLYVCHRCDNPPCVNPAHLFVGTHDDNMADKKAKGRNCYGDSNGSRKHIERMPRGETHPTASLTDEQALEVVRLRDAGLTYSELVRHFGVSSGTILNVVKARGRFTWLA